MKERKYTIRYSVKVTPSSDSVDQSCVIVAKNDVEAVSKAMSIERLKHFDYYQIKPISAYTEDVSI